MKTSKIDILLAAKNLFIARGYHGTSIGDIAHEVGLQKGSLYSHFKNKEDIANQVLNLAAQDIIKNDISAMNWRVSFEKIINDIAQFLKTNKRCLGLHFLYDLDSEHETINIRDFFENLKNHLSKILEQELNTQTAQYIAEDSLTILEGATVWLALNNDEKAMDRAVKLALLNVDNEIKKNLIKEPLSHDVTDILLRKTGNATPETLGEVILAKALIEAEGDVVTLRGALAGQCEAESCFR